MTDRRVCILGSTGSIGRQTIEVISAMDAPGQARLQVCGLAARNNWQLLADQARRLKAPAVALTDQAAGEAIRPHLPGGTTLYTGPSAMAQLVRGGRPDVLLSGVVGADGLKPTLAAIDCGAALAIANKETLVMAGAIVMPAARARGVPVLPVDSEHSAIFQCLQAGKRSEVRRVTITASGGALRDWHGDRADQASVSDALNHPTWRMGPKITIDSATLMNKALEVVEAHWLFDLPPEQIGVVIHPESIVHAMVEFQDGSVIAQMASPDMTLPIAYALGFPDRPARATAPLDLAALGKLTFREPSPRFARAINLGYQAIRLGGTAGAVLNAANERAVEAFMAGRISFGRIVPIVEEILNRTPTAAGISLDALAGADAWARREVDRRL